jgi:predicted nucleic acid-binding protein
MSMMANKVALKKQLLNRMEKLSTTDIREVIDFVEFLQIKRYKVKEISERAKLDSEKDPILKIMGLADVEPFTNKIDQELYGK